MTGDHWGLTLVTGGVQLNSIVRSHSHKPHWRVIRDLYIINSSQAVCPTIRTLHIPPGETVNNHGLEICLHNFYQVKSRTIFKFSFLFESRRGRTIRFLRFALFRLAGATLLSDNCDLSCYRTCHHWTPLQGPPLYSSSHLQPQLCPLTTGFSSTSRR